MEHKLEDTPFALYSCVFLCRGFKRSLIADSQRHKLHLIPNSMADILEKYETKTIKKIKKIFRKNNVEIDEYFSFLIENELIFFSQQHKMFPKMNPEWHFPFVISNAIIDIDDDFYQSYIDIVIEQLSDILCKYLQIRIYKELNCFEIDRLLNKFTDTNIESIELVCKNSDSLNNDNLIEMCKKYNKITILTLHSSSQNKTVWRSSNSVSLIYSTTNHISSCFNCGYISHKSFVINIKSYTESLAHNSCLNRKISIDVDGNIKNCPSMSQSFGNIKDTTLREALDHPDFKKYWNVTKDQIAVCKDCEFRYICTDCRAYLENPEDMYSKPLKCGYNPYTCEWEEWSTNPLKQKAIDYYGMRHILPEFKLKPDYVPPSQSAPTGGDRPQ